MGRKRKAPPYEILGRDKEEPAEQPPEQPKRHRGRPRKTEAKPPEATEKLKKHELIVELSALNYTIGFLEALNRGDSYPATMLRKIANRLEEEMFKA